VGGADQHRLGFDRVHGVLGKNFNRPVFRTDPHVSPPFIARRPAAGNGAGRPAAPGRAARPGEDDDAVAVPLFRAAGGGLDRARALPGVVKQAQIADRGVRDRAVPDVDDLVRAVRAEPGQAVRADRELDPGAPAEPRLVGLGDHGRLGDLGGAALVAGQRLDRDLAVELEPGHPAQLLGDDGRFERALGGQRRVLPIAAAAAARVRVRARRLHPVGRGLANLDRVGPGEPGRDLGHPREHPLAGQRVPHEQHRQAVGPGNAPAALRDVHGRDLDGLAHRIGQLNIRHPILLPPGWRPPT
jgi:hypothetical protein